MSGAWGDVPSWIGGLSTGGAACFAAREYRRSVRGGERAQAIKVAAWASSYSYSVSASGSSATAQAVVFNGSDLPIYQVGLALLPWDWETGQS